MAMRNALLAIDGSDHAYRAALFLVDFVQTHGPIGIQVVTVNPPRKRCKLCNAAPPMGAREAAQAHIAMKPVLHALNEGGISHAAQVRSGDVARTLVGTARELSCDVIVMGSRGQGAAAEFALGSVSREVLRLSPLPVVCIK